MASDWFSVLDVLVVLAAVLAVMPGFGRYLARVFTNRPAFGDSLLGPVERGLYRILGVSPREGMRFREYLTGLLLVNIVTFLWIYAVLATNSHLFPVQPGFRPMSWDLLVHTSASFVTNTDFTHFTNEASVTLWGAILAFFVPLFLSAASGLSVAAAVSRGFIRRDGTLGNVYVDLIRSITRILLPLALVAGGIYVLLGVPATLTHLVAVHPSGGPSYLLFLGPVAPWQAIELLGTNGGGFYGANAMSPLATPSVYVTLFGTLLMLLLPIGVPFAFGHIVRRPSESYPIVGTALAVFVVALILFGFFESTGQLLAAGARFPFPSEATFQVTSVYTNTGATNVNIGALQPLAQMVLLFGMFTQATPGGAGTGFATLLVNLVLAVFLGGLMVGRTPEYLGKKIGITQVKWAAFTLLIHPTLILVPTAVAYLGGFVTPYAWGGAPPPYCAHAVCLSAHNFTAVLYEFTSEAANNGSAISQINDGTMFFNLAGAVVMLLGRYLPILGMLAIAGQFADQEVLPPGAGTLRTRSLTFTVYLTLLLVIVTALLFLPVLALGPLSEMGG